jgi:ribonucleoside-diphosphate reductase beta chain
MTGTAKQLQYIMRDEIMHCSFGIRVVKQIMLENNLTLDLSAIRTMWDESQKARGRSACFSYNTHTTPTF